jgi:hypothetical protein
MLSKEPMPHSSKLSDRSIAAGRGLLTDLAGPSVCQIRIVLQQEFEGDRGIFGAEWGDEPGFAYFSLLYPPVPCFSGSKGYLSDVRKHRIVRDLTVKGFLLAASSKVTDHDAT